MSNPLPIIVLISGEGRNLQAIIDASHQDLAVDIKAVISNRPDAYGLKRAELMGIPAFSIPHQDYASRADFEAALSQVIDGFAPEWLVLAGFMRLLSKDFIDRYPRRILNIHPSLLPKYPGLNTHKAALTAKDKEHGTSIHLVDHGLDSGPLIAQAKLKLRSSDNEESLQTRVMGLETQLYPLVLSWLTQSRLLVGENKILLDNKPVPPEGIQVDFSAPEELQAPSLA